MTAALAMVATILRCVTVTPPSPRSAGRGFSSGRMDPTIVNFPRILKPTRSPA
jgi:hypothetical protein